MLKLLISFKTVFLSMQEKLKLEARWNECDIHIILGWFLYLKLPMPPWVGLSMFWWKLSYSSYFIFSSRLLTILEKKLLRQFATSVLSETSFSFSIKVIFSLDFVFSDRKGFIVCQKFLLSVIFFTLRLAKKIFFFFS